MYRWGVPLHPNMVYNWKSYANHIPVSCGYLNAQFKAEFKIIWLGVLSVFFYLSGRYLLLLSPDLNSQQPKFKEFSHSWWKEFSNLDKKLKIQTKGFIILWWVQVWPFSSEHAHIIRISDQFKRNHGAWIPVFPVVNLMHNSKFAKIKGFLLRIVCWDKAEGTHSSLVEFSRTRDVWIYINTNSCSFWRINGKKTETGVRGCLGHGIQKLLSPFWKVLGEDSSQGGSRFFRIGLWLKSKFIGSILETTSQSLLFYSACLFQNLPKPKDFYLFFSVSN